MARLKRSPTTEPIEPPTVQQIHGIDRQRKVINRLLDGFEGKLTTVKWAQLGKCSHDTALRDIHDLVSRGILTRGLEGGRSTSYELVR